MTTRTTLWLLLSTLAATPALAQAQAPLNPAQCGRRVALTLGLPWRAQRLGETPQAQVRELLKKPEVVTTFAHFVNSRFNDLPGDRPEDDPVIPMIRYVFSNDLPWRDVFVGRVKFVGAGGYPRIEADPTAPALGYFASLPWQKRYAGNEEAGWMLQAAYRTLQNTTGLALEPSPVNGQGDATATGRERAECRSCHYDTAWALDKVARLLPVRVGLGNRAVITQKPVTPQVLFGGATITDHEQLVQALVTSQAFTFWSCRLAFEFTFGRPESSCEAPLFDACADTLERTGRMQDALATLLESPAFCGGTP